MPIYEYRCRECGKKSTFLTLSVKSSLEPKCHHCGSRNVVKLVSRVAISRSEERRLESLADPANLSGVDESDPKSLARWMKRMGEETGEDFDGSIDEAMAQAQDGESGQEEGGIGGGEDEDL